MPGAIVNSRPREPLGRADADLVVIMEAVAAGRYPAPDATVTIVAQPSDRAGVC